ncbi:molybdopterin dehydrogenase FAD-binding [Chthoniobacter flavus Ellin428]|uniref:Molybdopterin dehydrogenase FAD-binding n=1 Tax=Chthoniobacter flavus Ellin428 TaxID=497964 RepID=B4CX88_9BACT|nr:xanthine dehydrogenase family protein subunit M [Chthoniobacter flavus]EDY20886.1 molybdopterin dehydrogenase FAD-binding [Chthoniobacter flavus Ellin428]TCO85626.1 xanthine dehydrogenase YagS FAD-binding subunit [Chthoniobacter flavus]
MTPFTYSRETDLAQATQHLAGNPQAKLLGGGTNLIDLMKMGVETPAQLLDIHRLPLAQIEALPDGGIRIGALARNSDTAEHPLVIKNYPLLREALLAGASPQLRNMATTGGNLLQRTRCPYFYDPAFSQCNKRRPGSGCGALQGYNRMHAILGQSEHCIAAHPSDMCVAMAALEAVIRVRSGKGERQIAFEDFHRLPGDTPEKETNLAPDEIITAVDLPPVSSSARSHYLKIRDRASYAFALVSAGVVVELEGNQIKWARVALGGVAHKPWRARVAEQALQGKEATPDVFRKAAEEALAGAKGYEFNRFKIELAKRCLVRALNVATAIA